MKHGLRKSIRMHMRSCGSCSKEKNVETTQQLLAGCDSPIDDQLTGAA